MDYVSRDSDKIRELLQRCLILPEWAKNAIQEQCDNNFRNEWNIEGLLNVDGEYHREVSIENKIIDNMVPELLQCIEILRCRVKGVRIVFSKLTSKGARLLIDKLMDRQSPINGLYLHNNQLDDSCIDSIAEAIQYLGIKILSIENNYFTDNGIKELISNLAGSKTLTDLLISSNSGVTDASFWYLMTLAISSNITNINVDGTSINVQKQKDIKHIVNVPVSERTQFFNQIEERRKQLEKKTTQKKQEMILDSYLNSIQAGSPFKKNMVNDALESDIAPVISNFLNMEEEMLKDVDIFETAIKVGRFEKMVESVEQDMSSVSNDEFQQKLEDIVEHCAQVDALEEEMIKFGIKLNNEEKLQKGIGRDDARSKVVQNFSLAKKFLDDSLTIKQSSTWQESINLEQEILSINPKTITNNESIESNADTSTQIIIQHDIQNEIQSNRDWVIEANDMVHNVIANLDIMKDVIEDVNKSIKRLHEHIEKNIARIRKKYDDLIARKELMEREIKTTMNIQNHFTPTIDKQMKKYEKRGRIDELEKNIEKKEEETSISKITIHETQTELTKRRKVLEQAERNKLEHQVKESEDKLKVLKMEHEDLIDELNEECNDENDVCIFPDHVVLKTIQSMSNSNNNITSKDLIRIPQTLKMKSNRCELLDKVDDGGFSSVYKMKMRKKGLDKDEILAFKQFFVSNSSISTEETKLIEMEIELLSQLKHDNIVKIISAIGDSNARDINDKGMGMGIVMEHCDNGSLRSLLNKYENQLDMNLIIHLLLGAAQGLEYLHNHEQNAIIHGDIKSDNILVDGEYNAKLCDFGISKLMQTTIASTKRDESMGGTLAYKSPESFSGKIELKSDVYSFGCVILEMLSGKRPWAYLGNNVGEIVTKVLVTKDQHDLSKIRQDAGKELIDLMKRCLDYDRNKRPTIKEVRMELERMVNNVVLIELDNRTDEYKQIENLFFPVDDKEGSLNRNSYRIIKIEKVRHIFAERRYDAEMMNMQSILSKETSKTSLSSSDSIDGANEKVLFHGTKQTNPLEILNHPDAFMKDYAKEGLYGKGLYFAELARYSNSGYRYNIPNTKHYQMLVCSVICGNSYEYGTIINKEVAQRGLGIEYHSVHAGPHGRGDDMSCMYVIYKDTQIRIRYLVTYEENE